MKTSLLLVALTAAAIAAAQPAPWRDPSPHQIRFVTVDEGVELEVVDWGGSGRSIVLLAGSGNSAHVFDDVAPKLTDCCHVYGITRRGYGASSRPAAGYDDQRLADDVFQVIERAHIDHPVLVGHSMSGGEMTTVGRQHSDRLGGIVYLDALGDLEDDPPADKEWAALQQKLPPGLNPPPVCDPVDRSSFAAYRRTFGCTLGFLFPESELRTIYDSDGEGVGAPRVPGWVSRAIGQNQVFRRDYSDIHVPVLALSNGAMTTGELLNATGYRPKDDEERDTIERFAARSRIVFGRWTDKLTRHVPAARIVYYPMAGHYVYMTREAQVLREIHTFVRDTGVMPDRWTPATPGCGGVPPFRVHEYNPTFFILRQSGCTNFEKPFLYLILGAREAMLVDTGARGADASTVVGDVLRRHAASQHAPELPLLVVHSHGHGDHVAADASFRSRAATRLIDGKADAVSSFFSIPDWPRGAAPYDLGDRVLDIVPIPGHEPASIAIYDRRTAVLLTGDTLYPGRLYVRDEAAFRASIDRLVDFTATREVAHVLGAHVENSRTPFVDYPEGTTYQPDEHVLELGRAHLLELQAALRATPGSLERRALRDFTIWPVTGK